MLTVNEWEQDAAAAGAAASREVITSGVDGADTIAAVSTPEAFDEAAGILEGLRGSVYATLRALQASRPQWFTLPAAGTWSTGLDGRPGASWAIRPDGRVELRGRLTGSSAGLMCGPLPEGVRPLRERVFTVAAAGGALTAQVVVGVDGWVSFVAYGTGAGTWLELDSIAFDLG